MVKTANYRLLPITDPIIGTTLVYTAQCAENTLENRWVINRIFCHITELLRSSLEM